MFFFSYNAIVWFGYQGIMASNNKLGNISSSLLEEELVL